MSLLDDIRVDIGDDSGAIPSGVPSHELLSSSHTDTTVGSASQGAVIVGVSSSWTTLPSGEENSVLMISAGAAAWGSGTPGPQGPQGASGVSLNQTLAETLTFGNTATLPIVWDSGLGDINHLQGPSDETYKIVSASGQSIEIYNGTILRAIISPTGTQLLNTVDINANRNDEGSGNLRTGTIQYKVDSISPNHSEGLTYWNSEDHTLDAMTDVSGTIVQLGQEMVIRVVNKTGLTIANGSVVFINGVQGNRPTVELAIASSHDNADRTIGLATSDIADNQNGYITTFGQVRNLNTSAYSEGTQLWLSASISGALTNIKPPSPNHSVSIGVVNVSHINNGIVQLRIDVGAEVQDLHDVVLDGLTDNQYLRWNESSGVWSPTSEVSASGLTNNGKVVLVGQNSASSYVIINTDDYLTFVQSSGATVVLNSSPEDWESHIIKDGTGQATVSPINIFGSGNLIDGLSSVSIASNWGSLTVVYNGTQWGIL